MLWPKRTTPPPILLDARPPEGTRIYAIGDIHGCLGLLDELHALIRADAAAAAEGRHIVVYLGDYVDRGPESAGVVDLLAGDPMLGFETRFLKGNHEAFMAAFADGDLRLGASWMQNGGLETLRSYGIDTEDDFPDFTTLRRLAVEFAARLPADHRQFLQSLVPYHVEGGYAFVHAGVLPGVPLHAQAEEDLLWIREPFLSAAGDHGYVIVHGHTPVRREESLPNRINVDTGAVYQGRLTAAVLAGAARRFLSVGP